MLSLKLVMFALIPISDAILSSSAWYQWSLQVSQLKVPVGPGVAETAARREAAAVGAALAADVDAAAVAGAWVAAVAPHAARNAPSPAVAPAAAASFRNSRRWSCLVSSSMPASSSTWSDR